MLYKKGFGLNGVVIFWALLGLFLFAFPKLCTGLISIQVCQNKDCCRRYEGSINLVQTLRDLLLVSNNGINNNNDSAADSSSTRRRTAFLLDSGKDIEIESTGCLSGCGKGPNIKVNIQSKGGTVQQKEMLFHGIDNANVAAGTLEMIFNKHRHSNRDDENEGDDDEEIIFPSAIIAAINVMEKSLQSEMNLVQREKYLNSVIKVLSSSSAQLSESMANAHAYTLRGEIYYEMGNYQEAIQDLRNAIILDPQGMHKAYRVYVDCLCAIHDYRSAIDILKQWGQYQPLYKTKINKEIQQLVGLLSSSSSSSPQSQSSQQEDEQQHGVYETKI